MTVLSKSFLTNSFYDIDEEWAVQLDTHRPAHEGARLLVNLGCFQQREEKRFYGGIIKKYDHDERRWWIIDSV